MMSGEEIHRCKRGSRLAQRITFNCGEVTTAVVLPTAKNLLALRPTHPDEISKFLDPNRKLHSGGLQKSESGPKAICFRVVQSAQGAGEGWLSRGPRPFPQLGQSYINRFQKLHGPKAVRHFTVSANKTATEQSGPELFLARWRRPDDKRETSECAARI